MALISSTVATAGRVFADRPARDAYRHVWVRGRFLTIPRAWCRPTTRRRDRLLGDDAAQDRRRVDGAGQSRVRGGRGSRSRGAVRGEPSEAVTVTGLLRICEPGGGLLRSNDAARDRCYSRDVAAIARARVIGAEAP